MIAHCAIAARIAGPLLAAAALFQLQPTTDAQCNIPDNLTGPCWDIVDANLPQLDGFALPGSGICYTDCDSFAKDCVRIQFSPPQQVKCAKYESDVSIVDCAGVDLMRGRAALDYTRTWMETTGTQELQVWRFLVKIDLMRVGPTSADFPCTIPPAIDAFQQTFYYGYVDWARDCGTNQFRNAVVLFHNCDWFIHNPGISSQPGPLSPVSMYALVAPDTTANPFDPTGMARPGGALVSGAMRNQSNPIAPFACMTEERLVSSNVIPLISLCFCPPNLGSVRTTFSFHDGVGSCPDAAGIPSSFSALEFFPTLPWFYLTSTSIGTWTTGASYPGKEAVWVDEGFYRHRNSCPGVAGGPPVFPKSADVMYGASTNEGFTAFPVVAAGGPISQHFLDLASNLSHPIGAGIPLMAPLVGSVGPTDHLIYANY